MFWDVMPKKLGGGTTGTLHIGRRVQLCIWLQILQEWIGIAGVTIYANDIFRQSGFTTFKARWLAGINVITYMVSPELPSPRLSLLFFCPPLTDVLPALHLHRRIHPRQTRTPCDALLG